MEQKQNLPALTGQANTYSPILFFKDVQRSPTLRQYEKENISDSGVGFSGSKLARYHIGVALQKIYQVVGLKPENEPTKELAVTIARYIQKTYYYLSIEDLYQAFEFALQGKFQCGKEHLEHYQVMDIKYLNRVFFSYAKYRQEIMKILAEKTLSEQATEKIGWIIESRTKNDLAIKESLMEAFLLTKRNEDGRIHIRGDHLEWLTYIGILSVSKEEYNDMIHDRLRHSTSATTYYKIRILVNKDIIVRMFKKWIVDEVNPMEEYFNKVSFLSMSDTTELIKQREIEKNTDNRY